MARLRIYALAVLLLAGIAATAVTVFSRANANTTTKVDVDAVAREARKNAPEVERGLRPVPGTYTYRVRGTEGVSALGGAEHSFGPEAPAVVQLEGTGCEWTIQFVYAKEHDVTSRYCTDEGGTRLLETNTIVKFFGYKEVVDQPCTGKATWLVRTGAQPGDSVPAFTCANDKRSTTHHPVIQEPVDAPQIDGIDPETLTFVKDSIVVGGSAKGTNPIETWFAPSGLPVKIHEISKVSSPSILGDTDYDLDITAELVSSTPK